MVPPHNFPVFFPVFFVLMWFVVGTTLGFVSGWYGLMRRYPDKDETPLLTLRNRSGGLGWVNMSRILVLSACPSGLRVGMMRIFGPFCRSFFVPWDVIRVERKNRLLWRTAVFEFNGESYPRLSIADEVANRLAIAAGSRWPEPGPFVAETDAQAGRRIFQQWLAITMVGSAFFTIAPRLMAPAGARPPIAVAVLFPAIVFGIGAVIQYVRRKS